MADPYMPGGNLMLTFDTSPTTPADWTLRYYMHWMHNEHRTAHGKSHNLANLEMMSPAERERFGGRKTQMIADRVNKQNASLCWAQLRDARVFHVGENLVKHTYLKIHRWLTEAVAGFEYESFWYEDNDRGLDDAGEDDRRPDWKHLIDAWKEASVHAPWPERFVFPNMLLGYGEGYDLDEIDRLGKFPAYSGTHIFDDLVSAHVVAHLVTESGYVWEFVRFNFTGGRMGFSTEPFRMADWTFGDMESGLRSHEAMNAPGWRRSFDTTQYLVPTLIHLMTQYRTLVVESDLGKDNKRTFRHKRKQLGLRGPGKRRGRIHAPPPFYRVKLKTKVVDEVPEYLKNNTPRRLTYRHDVRGHERCKVRRGQLPLDPKLRAKMVGLGYRVYDRERPGDDDNKRLLTRGHPLRRADEWVAIKSRWIRPFVRGDESLPYVPALRVATGGGGE
jgi:hypothetical protein